MVCVGGVLQIDLPPRGGALIEKDIAELLEETALDAGLDLFRVDHYAHRALYRVNVCVGALPRFVELLVERLVREYAAKGHRFLGELGAGEYIHVFCGWGTLEVYVVGVEKRSQWAAGIAGYHVSLGIGPVRLGAVDEELRRVRLRLFQALRNGLARILDKVSPAPPLFLEESGSGARILRAVIPLLPPPYAARFSRVDSAAAFYDPDHGTVIGDVGGAWWGWVCVKGCGLPLVRLELDDSTLRFWLELVPIPFRNEVAENLALLTETLTSVAMLFKNAFPQLGLVVSPAREMGWGGIELGVGRVSDLARGFLPQKSVRFSVLDRGAVRKAVSQLIGEPRPALERMGSGSWVRRKLLAV